MGKYIIEVDESEIVECWNEQAVKEIGYQEYALKKCPEIKVKIYNPTGDCISRSDLKKEVVGMMINKADDLEEVEFEINATLASVCEKIDNAQTVEAYPFEQVQELVKLNQQFAQEIENLKRPQGKWVLVHPLQENDEGAYMCSVCNTGDWRISPEFEFCPYCGADMRKGGAE